jgi:hypothetical protein
VTIWCLLAERNLNYCKENKCGKQVDKTIGKNKWNYGKYNTVEMRNSGMKY